MKGVASDCGRDGKSAECQLQKLSISLDRFVGDREYFVRNCETERLGSVHTPTGNVMVSGRKRREVPILLKKSASKSK